MSELDRVERDLAAGLSDLASKARPRLDAWERFEHRRSTTSIEHAADDDDVEHGRRQPAPADLDPTETNTVAASLRMPGTRPRRRWPTLASAAAVVALVVVGVAVLRPVADDPSSTTVADTPGTIELRGADGDPDAMEAFAAVEAAYAAYNTGDTAEWMKARTAPQTDVSVEALTTLAQFVAAGARYEVHHCDYIGFAKYEVKGHAGYPPVEAHQFECDTTWADAFTTAAGIDFEQQFRWLVAHGRVVDSSSISSDSDYAALDVFAGRFTVWLRSEHPDSFADMPRTRGFYPPVQDMPAALELLDEFVAADDRYPLGD